MKHLIASCWLIEISLSHTFVMGFLIFAKNIYKYHLRLWKFQGLRYACKWLESKSWGLCHLNSSPDNFMQNWEFCRNLNFASLEGHNGTGIVISLCKIWSLHTGLRSKEVRWLHPPLWLIGAKFTLQWRNNNVITEIYEIEEEFHV